jgi:Fe-S-cluster-containing hydrogenase component 2
MAPGAFVRTDHQHLGHVVFPAPGGDPACAKFCPSHAIEWVDDLVATRTRKRAFAEKFKDAFSE